MCLNELKRNIENNQIMSLADFKRDLLMVFANAVMYNPRGHEVHDMTVEMSRDVLSRVDELLASLAPTPGVTSSVNLPVTLMHRTSDASGFAEEAGMQLRGTRASLGGATASIVAKGVAVETGNPVNNL